MDSPCTSHESERIPLQEFSNSDGDEIIGAEEDFAPGNQMEQSLVHGSDQKASPSFSLHHGSSSSISIDSTQNSDKPVMPKWLRKLLDNIVSDYWSRKKQNYGWRAGCFLGCVMVFAVLCINVGLVLAGALSEEGFSGGFAALNTGSGTYISGLSTFYHVLINVLSTMLLSASNYTLQVLSSPTRADLDEAHRNGDWLDVGVLSSRNIGRFSRRKMVMFLLLCLSSLPLHLFYNASIFKAIVNENSYTVDFIHEASTQDKSLNRSALTNLTASWQSIYSVKYPSGHGNLSLIYDAGYVNNHSVTAGSMSLLPFSISLYNHSVSELKPYIRTLRSINRSTWAELNNTDFEWNYTDQYPWNVTKLWNDSDPTTTYPTNMTVRITEAWAQKIQSPNLRVSLLFMLIVIGFNVLKLVIMLSVLICDQKPRLATVGDAIASFLEEPDVYTSGHCTISTDEYFSGLEGARRRFENNDAEKTKRRNEGFWDVRRRCQAAVVLRHPLQTVTILTFICILAWMAFPWSLAIPWDPENVGYPDNFVDYIGHSGGYYGWGTTSVITFSVSSDPFGSNGMLLNALVANTPQLLLSVSYVLVNNLFTGMAMVREYNDFASQRKGLRVSQPQGHQRTTYFLSLPFRWAIPLNSVGGLLHWMMSQTLFFKRIDQLGPDGKLIPDGSESACGYSISSALALLLTLTVLFKAATAVGMRTFEARMPYASSCSWVISAACHPPPEEQEPHLKRVKWGVVQSETYALKGVQHCSFSSGPVRTPEPDVRYE